MSFFEPPPPPEPREQPPRPPWIGPSDGEIGAPAPLGLVLARTDRVAIAIANACAFRNGLTFDLALRVRELAAEERRLLTHGMPFRRQLEPGEAVDVLPPELLRLGVQLADGRKATTLASHRHLYGAGGEPEGPVLVHRGGGGGDRAWDQRFWLWPLPPPGPLAFVVEWPLVGIAETRVEVDAQPLLDAAAKAIELWPGRTHGGGWTSQVAMSAMRPDPERKNDPPAM